MYKVCKLNDKGSAVIELSFIMPIVFGIIVLLIYAFLDLKEESKNQCDKYTALYVESEEKIYGDTDDTLWRWQLYGDILRE